MTWFHALFGVGVCFVYLLAWTLILAVIIYRNNRK